VFGKFVQLIPNHIVAWNVWLTSFYRGRIFIKIHRFWSDWFFSFLRKTSLLRTICLYFSKISTIEHRAVIKFFIRKGLDAAEISKELNNVYKDSAPSYRTDSCFFLSQMEEHHLTPLHPKFQPFLAHLSSFMK